MYKKRWIFFVLGIIIFVSSCYDENNNFGDHLVDSVFTTVRIDTSSVSITLMKMDSIETNGLSTALVGEYDHPVWGEIQASSYLPFSAPSYNKERDRSLRFDSIRLAFYLNPHFVGDTMIPYTLNVHRLKEKVKLEEKKYLYNTSTFEYEEEPEASLTFYPRPNEGKPYYLLLEDSIGRKMFDLINRGDEQVSSANFENYFPGYVLLPGEGTESLLSFAIADTTTRMIIHYHSKENAAESTININVNKQTQFNHFSQDTQGTDLDEYMNMRRIEIPSTELGGRGMLFGGLGWYCRMDFPYLNNLMKTGEQIDVESAYLRFTPEVGTYSNLNALPDSLFLYIATNDNVITGTVNQYLGSQVQKATLVNDKSKPDGTYYYFNLTDFIQQEMGTMGYNKHNLQLVFSPKTYTTTFQNLTFSDQTSKDNPLKLEITYKIYEKY